MHCELMNLQGIENSIDYVQLSTEMNTPKHTNKLQTLHKNITSQFLFVAKVNLVYIPKLQ